MDLQYRLRYHSNRIAECIGELPGFRLPCPCFGLRIFGRFCRFKETVKTNHRWCDLKRYHASFAMQPGESYFFLFQRMRCYLVNRMRRPSFGDYAIFLTNLTPRSSEVVSFSMSVSYTEGQTTVRKSIDTECVAHTHNPLRGEDATDFIVCPKVPIRVRIDIER